MHVKRLNSMPRKNPECRLGTLPGAIISASMIFAAVQTQKYCETNTPHVNADMINKGFRNWVKKFLIFVFMVCSFLLQLSPTVKSVSGTKLLHVVGRSVMIANSK
jgi:hypothetical protein